MVALSVGSALLSVVLGLWLSWLWNLPSGASIVLFSAALFFGSYLVAGVVRGRRGPELPT
jgi:ABC-type Mn2+/Zn2+ transport system permease subunit